MIARLLIIFVKLLSGAKARWFEHRPFKKPRVYFANHTSHLDFLLIWAMLPKEIRRRTLPVAAKDYWGQGRLRRYLATTVFNAILVERQHCTRQNNPLQLLLTALINKYSLIIFPEGTRNQQAEMGSFKCGMYHLARKMPDVEFVPVYIQNLNRMLPKGAILPVPMLCSVTFGAPLRFDRHCRKEEFLLQAKTAIEQLKHLYS